MHLTLSDEEAKTLQAILHDYLPDLRREAAHTDIAARELWHELVRRTGPRGRVRGDLPRSAGPPAGAAPPSRPGPCPTRAGGNAPADLSAPPGPPTRDNHDHTRSEGVPAPAPGDGLPPGWGSDRAGG